MILTDRVGEKWGWVGVCKRQIAEKTAGAAVARARGRRGGGSVVSSGGSTSGGGASALNNVGN